jgi:hypothetical protein
MCPDDRVEDLGVAIFGLRICLLVCIAAVFARRKTVYGFKPLESCFDI